MTVICTNPKLYRLLQDLYQSRQNFLKENNFDCVKLIDCIRDKIMNDYFKEDFQEDNQNGN